MSEVAEAGEVTELRDVQREAFETLRGEIDSFPEHDMETINVDIMLVVTLVLGAWNALLRLRPLLVQLLGFNIASFDKLESYAYATAYAHGDYILAITPTEPLPELAVQGAHMRELLLSNAVNLAKHGIINGDTLGGLKGSNGYRNLAVDLTALSSMLRHQWSKIEGKTPLTLQDLEKAAIMSARLMKSVGIKERTPSEIGEAALRRQRAFTLLLRAYQEAQDGVAYVRRHEGDAEIIAPSPYIGRNNGGRKRPGATTPAPETPPGETAPTTLTTPAVPTVPVGHQGGSPTIS